MMHAFAFKDDELVFARAVAERANVWIWRVSQRSYGGDFVLVDVSDPRRDRRVPIALDLKRGQSVKTGRAGVQMKNANAVVAEITATGVIAAVSPLVLTGACDAVLEALPMLLRQARALVS